MIRHQRPSSSSSGSSKISSKKGKKSDVRVKFVNTTNNPRKDNFVDSKKKKKKKKKSKSKRRKKYGIDLSKPYEKRIFQGGGGGSSSKNGSLLTQPKIHRTSHVQKIQKKKKKKNSVVNFDFRENMNLIKARLKASKKINMLNLRLEEVLREMNSYNKQQNLEIASRIGYKELSLYINSDQEIPFSKLIEETKGKSQRILGALKGSNYNRSKVLQELSTWFTKVYDDREEEKYLLLGNKSNGENQIDEKKVCDQLMEGIKEKTDRLAGIKEGFQQTFQQMKHQIVDEKNREIKKVQEEKDMIQKDVVDDKERIVFLQQDLSKAIEKFREVDTRNKVLERMLEKAEKDYQASKDKGFNERKSLAEKLTETEKKNALLEINHKRQETEIAKMEEYTKYLVGEKEKEKVKVQSQDRSQKDFQIQKLNQRLEQMQDSLDQNKRFEDQLIKENEKLRDEIKERRKNAAVLQKQNVGSESTKKSSSSTGNFMEQIKQVHASEEVVKKDRGDDVSGNGREVVRSNSKTVEMGTNTITPNIATKVRTRQKIIRDLDKYFTECKKMVFQIQFSNSVTHDKLFQIVDTKIKEDVKQLIQDMCLENSLSPYLYFQKFNNIRDQWNKKIERLETDQNKKLETIIKDTKVKKVQESIIENAGNAMFLEYMYSSLDKQNRRGKKKQEEEMRQYFVRELLTEKEGLKDKINEQLEKIYKLRNMFYDSVGKNISFGVETQNRYQQTDEKRIERKNGVTQELSITIPDKVVTKSTGCQCNLQPVVPRLILPKDGTRPPLQKTASSAIIESGKRIHTALTTPKRSKNSLYRASMQKMTKENELDFFFRNLEIKVLENENLDLRGEIQKLKFQVKTTEKVRKELADENNILKTEVDDLENELAEGREKERKREKIQFDKMFTSGENEIPVVGKASKHVVAIVKEQKTEIDPFQFDEILDELEFSRSANEYIVNKIEGLITKAMDEFPNIVILPVSDFDINLGFLEKRNDLVCLQLAEIFQKIFVLYESFKKYIKGMDTEFVSLYKEHVRLKKEGVMELEEELRKKILSKSKLLRRRKKKLKRRTSPGTRKPTRLFVKKSGRKSSVRKKIPKGSLSSRYSREDLVEGNLSLPIPSKLFVQKTAEKRKLQIIKKGEKPKGDDRSLFGKSMMEKKRIIEKEVEEELKEVKTFLIPKVSPHKRSRVESLDGGKIKKKPLFKKTRSSAVFPRVKKSKSSVKQMVEFDYEEKEFSDDDDDDDGIFVDEQNNLEGDSNLPEQQKKKKKGRKKKIRRRSPKKRKTPTRRNSNSPSEVSKIETKSKSVQTSQRGGGEDERGKQPSTTSQLTSTKLEKFAQIMSTLKQYSPFRKKKGRANVEHELKSILLQQDELTPVVPKLDISPRKKRGKAEEDQIPFVPVLDQISEIISMSTKRKGRKKKKSRGKKVLKKEPVRRIPKKQRKIQRSSFFHTVKDDDDDEDHMFYKELSLDLNPSTLFKNKTLGASGTKGLSLSGNILQHGLSRKQPRANNLIATLNKNKRGRNEEYAEHQKNEPGIREFGFREPVVGKDLAFKSYDVLKKDQGLKTQKVSALFHVLVEKKKLIKLQAELYSLNWNKSRVSQTILDDLYKMRVIQEKVYLLWVYKLKQITNKRKSNLEIAIRALKQYVGSSMNLDNLGEADSSSKKFKEQTIVRFSYGKGKNPTTKTQILDFPSDAHMRNTGNFHSKRSKQDIRLPEILQKGLEI